MSNQNNDADINGDELHYLCYDDNSESEDKRLEDIQELVKRCGWENINVNRRALDYYATPLIYAASVGYIKIVKFLLEEGNPDINLVEITGGTALHCAAASGHKEIVELLLEHGVDVDIMDKDGETALDWARKHNYDEIVLIMSFTAIKSAGKR